MSTSPLTIQPSETELAQLRARVADLEQRLSRGGPEVTNAAYLTAIVEGSNDAIIGKTLSGIVTSWNRAAEKMFGYTAAEMIGQPISRLVPPDRPNDFAAILEQVQKGKRVDHYETLRQHKDGRILSVSLTVSPIRDSTGRIVGASKIARDITERKRSEIVLRQSEERLRATFDQAAIGIAHVGMDGRWLQVNQQLCEIVGYTPDELLQLTFDDITHPDDLQADWAQARALLNGEIDRYSMEKRYIHKDGSLVWINLTVSLLQDEAGRAQNFISFIENITPRKQAEEALRQSEERFRNLFALLPLGAVVADQISKKRLMVNDAFCNITGYSRQELLATPSGSLTYPADAAADSDAYDSLVRGTAEIHDAEKRYVCKDGHIIWVRAVSRPLSRDAEGRVVRIMSVLEDITARKEAEASLAASEAELRRRLSQLASVYRGAPVALSYQDTEGRFVEVNDAMARIDGCPASEHIGRTTREVMPELGEKIQALHRHVLEAGEPLLNLEVEAHSAASRSELRSYLASFVPALTADGAMVGITTAILDITERKAAEEQLRASEERFRELADNISQFAWVADRTGWIFWYNQRWYNFTGSTPEEMQGWGWRKIHHPDQVHAVTAKFKRCIEKGEAWEDTFPLRSKDGNYRWFLSRARPIRDAGGEIVRWFGTNTDITEQRDAEQSLRTSQAEVRQLNATLESRITERTRELEEVNQELEAFSYSVSHDLRAPLRSIDGFGQRLLERYTGRALDETGMDYLRRMTRASRRMGRLIEDLLNFSRFGRAELHRRFVDLSRLAESVVADLRAGEPQRKVTISVQPGLSASGDPGLLRVVLENLLGNAWKYTGKKDEASIEFGALQQDGGPVYYVRDDGAGFDMVHAGHLFAPFQRLHRESEFEGTGIGLATAQRILHRHGGRIWTEAEVGKGATFFFTLPVVAEGKIHET